MAISRRHPRLSPNSPEFIRDAFRLLELILLAYSDQYRFRENSIFWDSKTAPLRHIKSSYLLARLWEESHIKSFQVLSLKLILIASVSPDRYEDILRLFSCMTTTLAWPIRFNRGDKW
jgi:hypothetical protein